MARKSRKNMMPQAAVQEAVQQNEKELLRTAAYARLSVENGGHETEDSLHTQILQIHNYIRENPELTLTDTYADNGFTGTRFDRPEFERMMQDIRTGKIQCIVVKDLSRFGRDYIETGSYLETIFPIQKIFSTRRVFHSAGMCLLEAEGFYPCGQVGFAGIGIEHLAMQQFCTGAARSKLFIGLAHVAAARCGKGDDCFTFQIIAFQKCIDNRRSNIPPNRESDKDGVVFVHVIALDGDGRARGGIAHFDGAAGFLVHPVQIGLGVRNFRLNLKNVCTDSIGKIFSNLCGNAAGGEVSNKSFAHDKCTSFDRFSWFKYSTLNREHQVRLSGRMC